MTHAFDTIEKALEDLRAGKIILVTDDPDRENEGDFICAGEFATPENINFMAVHGRGLICMPMSGELCDRLGLAPMVAKNTDNHETAFTVRNGHTEATVDLCRLAGLAPCGLCCEIMADDGTMMRTPELIEFARRHDMTFITIADLQAWIRARA